MVGGSSERDPCVVVVGDPCSESVRAMVRRAKQSRVEAMTCEDVYLAVATMARASGRQMLVVGALRELAKEEGRFFEIVEANAHRCCCFVDHDPVTGPHGMLAAIRSGTRVVHTVQEVGQILDGWLSSSGRRTRYTDLGDLKDDDLHATEAELIALLGRQADG